MNESEHHPKLKVHTVLGSPVFVAGGDVYGKVEVESRADTELGLRSIFVELAAIEQLTSKYHAARSLFVETRLLFQGPSLPPSNAVRIRIERTDSALPPDYLPARKGRTSFFFKLPLPLSSPSSLQFGGNLASITYRLKASAEVVWKGEKRQVVDSNDLIVVESPEADEPGTNVGEVAVGEGGKIWAHGRILEQYAMAGQPLTCRLHVKNNSLKKISGLSLKLVRKLHLDHPAPDGTVIKVSDTLASVPFHGPEYTVQAFSEGVAHLVLNIPRSARGVRKGPREAMDGRGEPYWKDGLFSVQCYIVVSLSTSFLEPDLEINIPVRIYHQAAVPEMLRLTPLSPPAHHDTAVYNEALLPNAVDRTNLLTAGHPNYEGQNSDANYSIAGPDPPYWHPSAPPVPLSPQHEFYYDALADTDPQYVDPQHWPSTSSPALILPPEIPPRPMSAGPPASHTSILDMPYSLPYSGIASGYVDGPGLSDNPPVTPQTQQSFGITASPHSDRASRVSRHLRLTSRHRSVSPPRSRHSVNTVASPSRLLPEDRPSETSVVTADLGSPPKSTTEALQPHSPPILSPRPVLSPRSSLDGNEHPSSNGRSGDRSPQVEELEWIVSQESADLAVSADTVKGPTADVDEYRAQVDKTLPRPPLRSDHGTVKNLTAIRGIPVAAFGSSTIDTTSLSPPKSVPSYESSSPTGLTLLERRLGRPAAYEIFNRVEDTPSTVRAEEDNASRAREAPPIPPPRALNTRESEPEPVTRGPARGGRRLRSAARVNEWLKKEETEAPQNKVDRTPVERQDGTPISSFPRRTAKIQESQPSASTGTEVSDVSKQADVDHIVGLKAAAHLAVSPHLSDLDWKTLDRGDSPITESSPLQALPSGISRLAAPDTLGSKYDVRSARGGRGGKVTSAAAFWSAQAGPSHAPTSAKQVPRRSPPPKITTGFSKSVLPLDTLVEPSAARAPPLKKPAFIGARAGALAPTTVNDTIGRPLLSTSATLRRPVRRAEVPLASPRSPVLQKYLECTEPAPRIERGDSDITALGRERFRQLMSRYQGH